ncbi:zinc-binding dehydrogenase [Sphaerochaeta sp. PS]|uniref:zinc-dependent alcohol dehydrogenase n=1 Tax=Sphaerochaeta sp. PS TaxID=3076336 RepID=UPI0028A3455E|nr:zinc-binding dehydrogenase [Sphaerochaeta sp. PS]MDT4762250.1 zinc-binding dehydrogenase [Sphaerochaeta sp. PS]
MKALYYVGDKAMELREVDRPVRKGNEYLIEVKSNGICGSDFEGYMGKTGRRTAPMIMGHEFSGVISQAPQGGKFAIGTKVVVFPKPYCGVCDLCKKGMVNVCPEGICMGVLDFNGSMCEYVSIEEKYLLPFDGISFNEAAFTEPLAVAYRSVHKISDQQLAEAEYTLVIGAGTIGLLALALLKYRGAKNIIISDATEFRLDVARKLGADFTINPRTNDFTEEIGRITKGKGCDFAIEAVGIAPTAANSLECLKIGGTAIWIGNAQKMVEVNMQKIVTKELTIKGNYVYDLDGFADSLRLLQERKIDIMPLMTHIYKLEEGVQAFKDLENNRDGKMLKVMLEN